MGQHCKQQAQQHRHFSVHVYEIAQNAMVFAVAALSELDSLRVGITRGNQAERRQRKQISKGKNAAAFGH